MFGSARAIDTSRVDTSRTDRDRLRSYIRTLATIPLAEAQAEALRTARAGEHSVIELVYVQLAGTHDGVHVAAGDLEGLVTLAETRVAELRVVPDGPSFAGLVDRGVSADRIAALTALAARYRFGTPGATLESIAADEEELARLTTGLPALDPMSAVSLRHLGTCMRQAFDALQAELGPTISEETEPGMSLEEFEERERRYREAGDQIREGVFAGLFFTIAYARSGDRDYAARAAGLGAAVDGLVSATGATIEGAHAAHEAPRRDASGRIVGEPSIVGIDGTEAPRRPEPETAPVPIDTTAPRGETPTGRRARERSTMGGHADRFRRTRRP